MLPLPSRSHPQKQNRPVYTKELTHPISPRDYLSAVLPGLADTPMRRLPTLTPTAWAAQHQ
jgi:hypothetical protein